MVIVLNSDDASDDNPPLFSAEVPAATPTEPAATPTESPARTIVAPTPAPLREAAPPSAPPDYRELGPAYAPAETTLRADGRAFMDALLNGDTAAAYARFSDELKARLPEHELLAALEEFRGDRVHFSLHAEDEERATHAVFDGRLTGDTISGSFAFVNEATGTFSLERSSPTEPTAPLAGQLEGTIVIGVDQLAIAVTFSGEGKALSGTIDAPEGGLFSVALEDVGYEPSVEGGALLAESVLPLGADVRVYTGEYAWGPSTVGFKLAFDGSGTVFQVLEPYWRTNPPRTPPPTSRLRPNFGPPSMASGGSPQASAGASEPPRRRT